MASKSVVEYKTPENKKEQKISKKARRYKDEEAWDAVVPDFIKEPEIKAEIKPEIKVEIKPEIKVEIKAKPRPSLKQAKLMARVYATTSEVKQEVVVEACAVPKQEHIAPVLCLLGNVDAGKTSLLDAITGTKLQAQEAGGITQSIGSRFIPIDFMSQFLAQTKNKFSLEPDIPGLLTIDSPGHAEFAGLRDVGSTICNVAILIVDINAGVQLITKDCIKMLKEKNVPFVVAVTKLDTLYGWKTSETKVCDLKTALKSQTAETVAWLEGKLDEIKYDLGKEGLDAEFYFKNKKPERTYSIVPISAKTGVGLGDLFTLLIYLTQTWMKKKITYSDKVNCMILETPKDKEHGYVLDVILLNGTLNVGDKFAVGCNEGSKIITIRNLLVPSDLSQLGKKTMWTFTNQVRASCGLRIIGSDLQSIYAGTHLHPVADSAKAEAETKALLSQFEYSQKGIYLLVSSFGELKAGYELFKNAGMKLANGYIGELGKKVYGKIQAQIEGELLEENKILAYFGKEPTEAEKLEVAALGINLVHSDVLYGLIEKIKLFHEKAIKDRNCYLIRPVAMSVIPKFVFNKGSRASRSAPDPIITGVKISAGALHKMTPIVVVTEKGVLNLGVILSIQHDKKDVEIGEVGKEVSIKLSNPEGKIYGRDFDEKDLLIAHLTRQSIDIAKRDFKEVLSQADWKLVIAHKKLLGI